MNRPLFVTGRIPPLIFILSFILIVSCAGEVKKQEPQKISFYELCFYFRTVPSGTSLTDIQNAADYYADNMKNNGISILKKKVNTSSVCYFTNKLPEFTKPEGQLQNNIAEYLITARFVKENSSLIAVLQGPGKSVVIHDEISLSKKLPVYSEIREGLSLKGTDKRLLIISRYLDTLSIKHQFGLNDAGDFIINIEPDPSARWMMIPFLYNSLNIEDFISPLPGDYAIMKHSRDSQITSKINIPSWELESIPVGKNQDLMEDDAIVFSSGVLSLPFDEEILLKYFYSLSDSYLLPPFPGLYYSPAFGGSSVFPRLLLFSSELLIAGEISQSPENTLLWALSVDRQIDEYPDSFYSNLLSIKIAKRFYTGTPSFLGGAELFNSTASVPFDKIRDYLFHKGNVTVFGSLKNQMYLNGDDLISEYPSVIDISRTERVKAYFGSSERSSRSIISIVFRSAKAVEMIDKISGTLTENGFSILPVLYEQIFMNDAWGAVSVAVDKKDEKKILDLYEKNFKLLDNTVSLGVYRVQEKE